MKNAGDDAKKDLEGLPVAYAAWRESRLGQATDAIEQHLLLDVIGSPAGLAILDVGCGDGALALELASRGALVTGADASAEMIAAARARARRQERTVGFEVAKAEALPFAAGSFDLVLAVTVLCFVEDLRAALGEMLRVLRPGGRVVVGELGKWSAWAAKRRVQAWCGSTVWRRARFRTASQLRRLAREAGLVDVSVTGAVFYPPSGLAARLLAPIDRRLGQLTTAGAAFLVLAATKPETKTPGVPERRKPRPLGSGLSLAALCAGGVFGCGDRI